MTSEFCVGRRGRWLPAADSAVVSRQRWGRKSWGGKGGRRCDGKGEKLEGRYDGGNGRGMAAGSSAGYLDGGVGRGWDRVSWS